MIGGEQSGFVARGSLYRTLLERTREALACGALHSIDTRQRVVPDGGVQFLVRSVSSLRRKQHDKRERSAEKSLSGKDFNPFLPPEPELTVGRLTPTHTAVLNKFNVLERHLLVVTRRFQHQESLLTLEDLEALWLCLGEIDGLGFYNAGAAAGASQAHKHLQLIPLPLAPQGPPLPMEALLCGDATPGEPLRIPDLPFRHRFCRLPGDTVANPSRAAGISLGLYRAMLDDCGIPGAGDNQSAPYNLLLRRDWMLLVPRSREHFRGISINALGYAGSLFVRDGAELEQVRRTGPMRVLSEVSLPIQTRDSHQVR